MKSKFSPLAPLLGICLAIVPVRADDIYWVGYQDGCMSNPPDEASFLHGDNWLNYVYPGEQCILDPGLPCDDRAIFGAEESPGGNPGWPHVVHFGDFCFNVPNCSAVTHPGNDVVIQRLEIQDDAFTFDFGPGSAAAGSCPNDPTASGSLTVTGANGISVIVGSVITDTDGTPTNLPVDAHLTIRNGTLAAKEFVVGDLGTSNGGITVSGQQGVLNCNNNLAIGQHGDGTLLIENGGSVFNTYADIGRFTGATGYAEVTGPTSTWTCSEWLNVGYLGDGTLVIDDGTVEVTQPTNLGSESSNGVVTVRNGGDFLLHHWIGLARTEGSTATLTVEDPGSAVVADEGLMVGVAGDGELTIRSSATVTSDVTNLGEQPGSTGRATIASGAVWNNAGWANVGWKGTGILNINGGTMSSAWIGVGTEATGIGTADVTSSGSWNTLGLNIGDKGHGTVTVSNQGSVVVADWSSLGSTAAEAHGELVVDNGSFETRGMNVGLAGTGVLTLRNGGQLSTEFDENDATGLTAGNFLGSHGTVTVDGSGSSLSIPHWMNVGWAGQGALTIQGGGQVAATWCGVGTESTGTGTVTVDGVGSSLSLRWLDVGIAGVGQVTVSNEASVTLDAEGWSSLGWDTADSSGRLEIVEGGSFDAPGMNVGLAGAGDFEISSGGQATFSDGITIGAYAGSSGTAAVTGLGSSLTSLDWMNVGADGEGTLNVTAGGSVSSPWCGIGVDPTGAGQVTVSGPGSTMSATLTIGWEGSGSMLVTNSGVVNAYEVDIAEVGPGTLRIQNAGIFSSHTQDFDCGNGGACTINIDSGGVLSVFDGGDGHAVAFVGNPGPGLATVSGPGSRFDVEGQLQVGSAGTGTLSVSDRGRVNITGNAPNSGGLGFIGMAAGSSGDVRVSGEGSSWTSRGQLQVASEGDGILLIEGGARVVTGVSNSPTNSSGIVGATAGSVGSVTVRDDGSEWQQDGGMSVGFNGVGVLSIEAGGSISSEHGFVGRFAGSTGDATVTGTNSRWDAAQQFFIGNAGGGSLSITNGGAVSMNWGGVGHRQGSHGAVLVDGGTSIWSATGTIFVGSEGTGTVTVANAGRVHAGLLDVRTRGTAGGNGSLECDVANAGAIHPGLSAGTLAIDGDYFQSATGTLNIEIGGTTPGTDYDRLDTAGTVILGGTLAVDLIGDYAPQPGDVFEIMTFASRDGRFADVFCVTLAGGNTLNVRYSATNVTLEVAPTCGGACVDLSLDCDGDGIPDACEIANCPPDTPSCADCKLDEHALEWDPRPAVCVVTTSAGYPGSYEKGNPIAGLDDAGALPDVTVYHAGTALANDQVVTSGGRVLGVTALGDTVRAARDRAYEAVDKLAYDGMYIRTDIAHRALSRAEISHG